SALIASLHAVSAAKPKPIKSSVYVAPVDPDIKVRSWKMDEFEYYDMSSPFPTLARGCVLQLDLFQCQLTRARSGKRSRHTHRAPYTLSLKSNGCIIFIAALTPTKLFVASKHSIGPTPGQSVSHSEAGEAWLRKYFAQRGKTEADLVGKLWAENWTAIAEVRFSVLPFG
ncbi:RNA ligase-domain-containing protein, partial [Mycena galopus ATCC 62051]